MKGFMKRMLAVIIIALLLCGIGGIYLNDNGNAATKSPPITITYMVAIDSKIAQFYTSYSSLPAYQWMEKKFNVKFKFMHPPVGSSFSDQLNLVIASGKLPDVIELLTWISTYSGGPNKALADKVIIPLNKYVDKYCPNLKKLLKEHPDWQRQALTDDGILYCFPEIVEKPYSTRGPAIRKDWLEKYGLKEPKTVDEWYKVLITIRKNDPNGNGKIDEWGYTMVGQYGRNAFRFPFLIGAYGILADFYVDNKKVYYGPIMPQFKEFIKEAQKWYANGLFHPSFIQNTNTSQIEPDILNDKVIAWNSAVSALANYPRMYNGKQKFSILVCENPVLKKGDVLKFWNVGTAIRGGGAAITPACKNVEKVCQVLDWIYSKEGILAFSYGVEGKSYVIDKDGKPKFLPAILNDPNMSPMQAVSRYCRVGSSGAFLQAWDAVYQLNFAIPEQVETLTKWSGFGKVKYEPAPPITMTSEEAKEYANIMQTINTFMDEAFAKLIMGKMTNVDAVVKQLKAMRIDRAIKIYQQALNRAYKRPIIWK